MKPRILVLFCGAGGCTKGYQLAGCEVTGVDIEEQPRYVGDVFHREGALALLERWLHSRPAEIQSFAGIHAAPPCQDYSRALSHMAPPTPRLIEVVRDLLEQVGLPWVIENVPGAPLPTQPTLDGRYGLELCGTQFGLRVGRHRIFESSFPLVGPSTACRCAESYVMNPHNQAGRDRIYAEFGKQNPDPIWNEAMGVPWMNKEEGREAIPPVYTEFIGEQLLAVETKVAA